MPKRPVKARVGMGLSHGPRPPARKKARAKAKSRVRRKSSAVAVREPLDTLIIAGTRALRLPIEPQWLPAIRINLEVTLRHGALIHDFVLPDDAEPAPVFEA